MKNRSNHLTIDYRKLGTISLAEFRQAVLTDLAALSDDLHIEYVTGPRLIIPLTNEYGRPITAKDVAGRSDIISYHFRPACKDYDL